MIRQHSAEETPGWTTAIESKIKIKSMKLHGDVGHRADSPASRERVQEAERLPGAEDQPRRLVLVTDRAGSYTGFLIP